MGRRYYCDFCDKSFIDDLGARKKHLSGLAHQQAKHQHYFPFRNPAQVLEEESRKTECRKYLKGTCVFGLNCNYSHYGLHELNELKRIVEENERNDREKHYKKEYIDSDVLSLDEWLKKYEEKRPHSEDKAEMDEFVWTYPSYLECRTDLPPSMVKFQPNHFVDNKFATWG